MNTRVKYDRSVQIYPSLKKMGFENKPVGVKFIFEKPKGVEKLKRKLAMCLMPEETRKIGAFYESKTTPVIGCAWTFVYPYITGKLNYVPLGLCFGHRARDVGQPGEISISKPFNLIEQMVSNLKEMTWELPAYSDGREGYTKRFKKVTGKSLITKVDYSKTI